MLIQAETLSWPETCYKACSRGALSSEYFLRYLAIFHLCSVFNTLKKKTLEYRRDGEKQNLSPKFQAQP